MEIRTPRLLLRPWRDDDLEPYAALNGHPRVREFFPTVLTREESDREARRIRTALAQRGYGLWAVEIPSVSPFIGFVGLSQPSFQAHFTPCVEVGWRLAVEHWGQGYATEGARAALAYGFDQVGLNEIVSWTAAVNLRSRRVMERLGMTRAPEDDFDLPKLPLTHPLARHVLYRLSRERWQHSKPPG